MPHPLSLVPVCSQVTAQPAAQVQWVVICGVSLLILYLLLRSGRKRKADPLARPAGQATLSQERNVERQMQNLLVELSDMARQITAQLDTRSTKLALMIDDADEKAAMLQRLLDDCRAALAAAPPAGRPADPPSAASSVAVRLPPSSADPDAVFAPSLALANESDARHQQVYALSDQGRSAAEIARQIDRPYGEIELILALRPR